MAKKRKTPSSPRSPYAADSAPDLGGDTEEHLILDMPLGAPTEMDFPALSEEEARAILADASLGDVAGRPGDIVQERRLTATLLRVFSRRRQEIRLSLDQLARLSGIGMQILRSLDDPRPGQTITYDQAVVLARVLGVKADELPGLRRKEAKPHLGQVLPELERTLLGAPLLRFEGQHGERYGGDVERAAGSKAFTVRIEDTSLDPIFRRGSLLGFARGLAPREGGILLLRHRRSSLLAMRRYEHSSFVGLVDWQPAYVAGGEWHVVGTLEVVLPPR